MAYGANIDYQAKINEIDAQLKTVTDPAQRQQLEAQKAAYAQSRMEKIAGNMQAYGKYADAGQLDAAAEFKAGQSINPTYDRYGEQVNKSYDTAKQNASNDALSRGMARSSFASDRLSRLDTDRADSISDVNMQRAQAIQNAKMGILDNYQGWVQSEADKAAAQQLASAQSLADTGDYSAMGKLYGWTPEQLADAQRKSDILFAQQTAPKKTGGGGGGKEDEYMPTYAQAVSALMDGAISTSTYAILKQYGWTDQQIENANRVAWAKFKSGTTTQTSGGGTTSYTDYGNSLQGQQMTDSQGGTMSQSQANAKLNATYANYGQTVADSVAKELIRSGQITQAQYNTWYSSLS